MSITADCATLKNLAAICCLAYFHCWATATNTNTRYQLQKGEENRKYTSSPSITNDEEKTKNERKKKVILITGASAGIGKVAALQLAQEQEGNDNAYVVYGAARRPIPELVQAGGFSLQIDLTKDDQIQQGIQTIINQHGRIDILINNAGYGEYGPAELISLEKGRRQFEVNFFASTRLIQLVIPYMREQYLLKDTYHHHRGGGGGGGGGGKIINISSVGSVSRNPFSSWYFATKAALEQWLQCVRLEVQGFGIQVVVIRPGLISTQFMDLALPAMLENARGTQYETFVKNYARNIGLMFRFLGSQPKVIADVICDVCSTECPKQMYTAGGFGHVLEFVGSWMPDWVNDMALLLTKSWEDLECARSV